MNREMLEAKWSEIHARMKEMIPAHMYGAVERWLWYGAPPGDFLSSVLANDLKGAAASADSYNAAALANWARFFTWYMPGACWGSDAKVQEWAAERGWNGMLVKSEEVES